MFSFLLEGGTANNSGALGGLSSIIMLVVVVIAFYFLLIRPQKKQEKAANEMRNSLQKGDEITTIGGIVGKIVGMTDETITIETSKDKTKIRFVKSAVRSVDVKANESQEGEQ